MKSKRTGKSSPVDTRKLPLAVALAAANAVAAVASLNVRIVFVCRHSVFVVCVVIDIGVYGNHIKFISN